MENQRAVICGFVLGWATGMLLVFLAFRKEIRWRKKYRLLHIVNSDGFEDGDNVRIDS